MEPICCIAIDDEPLALEKITGFISRLPQLKLAKTFNSSTEAVFYIMENPDYLVFLDIQMKNMTGIQMLEALHTKPPVILTTAYSEFALKGYDLNVIDYLLKPISFERFSQAVLKAYSRLAAKTAIIESTEYIFVKSDYRIVKVFNSDLYYIEGMRDFRCLVTKTGKILTSLTFSDLETILPKPSFARIHKSYMVNTGHIETIERHRIKIHGTLLPISDSYKDSFYSLIKFKAG
jgi:two-component system, LytTR family, response regulator